ncbi:hypothetical protein SAMD00019534_076420 [Acytostelium subglobosum LB1]|uniref:hypothetical protein n=1 Tax=Acytostelium subglobosum LB1 TaxID=1410327 RepID=UPI0006450855|nr:hypothetical protein SAMD00019534_076420 [Acytostelium subglobosum LB1]GAM24467.1 hypothetical protein SAMD00019534_076420 [Acytostelium subglobosum LB1]|eukprot:XP_012752793.1 hypothetical protein SAMD00019534_076420 [Acytostelium subglobosum LB1]
MERLEVIQQTSPFEEKVTMNGIPKNIRVVIKNSPFNVQLKLKKHDVDLNNVAFEATLLYDNDEEPLEEKEVDFVKNKPVEYKATPNDTGDTVTCEVRIKVLTSQHEDMFFRVKIAGHEPVSKQIIPNLFAITHPIKVISKPEQLKKKQPQKKRSWNDILLDSVAKIQMQQSEQQRLIEKLIDHNFKQTMVAHSMLSTNGGMSATNFPALTLNGHTTSTSTTTTTTLTAPNGNNLTLQQKMEFEDAFKQMMSAYIHLDPRQRAEKVRRVFRNASSRDSETLSELLDLFITEGVGGPLGSMAPLPLSPNPPSSGMPIGTQPQIMVGTPPGSNPFGGHSTLMVNDRNQGEPYPLFTSLPTSFDEYTSFNNGTDFIPF